MDNFILQLISVDSTLLVVLLLYILVLLTFGLRYLQKSDRRARLILESIDDFFITLDNKWRFSYVNARACQSMGFSRSELMGKKLTDIYPGFDKSFIFKQYQLAKRIKKPLTFPIKGLSGKDYNARVFPTSEGISVYMQDISRVKQYEKQLRESEQRFRSLADCAPVMIWLSGTDMKRYYFNQKWLDFRGRRWQDEIGDGWLEGIHPDDIDQFNELYLTSSQARIEFEMEYRLQRADGVYRWMLSRCMPRFDNSGKYLGYAGTVLDITDRKEVEERKNEFISIASHELKTPVTSIKAFTQLLLLKQKGDKDSTTYQYLKKVDSHLNNLTNLINDLLDVSRIEQGRIQFHKEEVAFKELVKEVIEDMRDTNSGFDIQIEQNADGVITGDKERLRQVLINLLDNAVKYSGDSKSIIVRSTTNDRQLTVSVQDFGVGIPPEKKGQIFERFYRVNGPMSETFGGLGLGLYICAEIIRRHGGRIWVESSLNQGSTFYFSLPIHHINQPKRSVFPQPALSI